MTLTLYGTSHTRAFRPLWLLEELGIDFVHNPCPPHAADLAGRSASGKVPALDVDGTAVTDSTAILTYLADREGRFTHPAGTLERGRQDALTQMALDELDAVLWTAARHSFVLPEERRVPQVKDSLKWEFRRSTARLTERMAGPYLMGDDLTVPDIVAVHCGGWAKVAGFDDLDPGFVEYVTRVRGRDAFRRAAARA